ncbi:LOG family protein [Candidatus Peregrinibacteria bacterium]|nr:LOG family protein [Candidatus Peregrinibacteria bacterium]
MGYLSNKKVQPLKISAEKKKKRFRVAIFGSARTKRDDQVYREVFDLAKKIGENGYDVVTGGGPGLMEAANAGHEYGDTDKLAESIGLVIELPFENKGNNYLELSKTFKRFSKRLDTFMELSNVMVVTKGGIGTMLELFYMWQHLQVHHIGFRPIILIGDMWERLVDWMKENALKEKLVSPQDFDFIYIAHNNDEALMIIDKFKELYDQEGEMRYIKCDQSKCEIPALPKKHQKKSLPEVPSGKVKDKLVRLGSKPKNKKS